MTTFQTFPNHTKEWESRLLNMYLNHAIRVYMLLLFRSFVRLLSDLSSVMFQ